MILYCVPVAASNAKHQRHQKMKTTDQAFKILNDLTDTYSAIGVITDDGDRDSTDATIWAAINAIREELQNALHA
jgi:predicted phosphoribosyltransferase